MESGVQQRSTVQRNTQGRRAGLSLATIVCVSMVSSVVWAQAGSSVQEAQEPTRGSRSARGMARGLPDIATLFEQQKPRVVAVQSTFAPQQGLLSNGKPRQGKGSGFLVDAKGLIITNHHVVRNARSITVMLANGQKLPAQLMGADPKTDLALLKINAGKPLPFVRFGDSGKARIGEWVAAIGSPFGLEYSVTVGILSAKGRNLKQGPYDSFLQTDASINPGNSGGPLFNLRGEVIGVNTLVVRGGQGIGFAVPSNMVKKVLVQLKQRGYVQRGYMGAGLQELNASMARRLGQPARSGVVISSVVSRGPADQAGLRVDDIITTFNGKRVRAVQELFVATAETQPNTVVPVSIIRRGRTMTLNLRLGERPDAFRARRTPAASGQARPGTTPNTAQPGSGIKLGIGVRALDPQLAAQLKLKPGVGALVAKVQRGGMADGALRQGDVLLRIGRYEIRSPADVSRAIQQHTPGKALRMLVLRQGRPLFVAVRTR